MSGRGSEISNNAVLERHESDGHRENVNLNALELLAQAPRNFQSNEQLTNNYVDKNALPKLTIDNKSSLLQDNIKGKKFELSAEAEKVAWDAWLAHLNDQIAKTLNKLVAEGKIPQGATGTASYVVAADGRFALSYEARPAAYAHAIGAALNDAFKNHKELLKFPEGAHKDQFKRTAKFSVGADTKVTNGPTEDEYSKK
jgi:hypothetical protein